MNGTAILLVLFWVAFIGVVYLIKRGKHNSGAKPKENNFVCRRCSQTSLHNNRTIEAWRLGKAKIFCDSCHKKWLSTQPRTALHIGTGKGSPTGCFGILIIIISIPLGLISTLVFNIR